MATVQYDATGNTERYVVRDDGLSQHEATDAIQTELFGAKVIDIQQTRLYDFGPASTSSTVVD
jgi:hypothetical protein